MPRRLTVPLLLIGAVAAGSLFAATALAAPFGPFGARGLMVQPDGPAGGLEAGLAGPVAAVNGSTYTMPDGPDGPVTVATTGRTVYVDADGSAAQASAVKAGVYIAAQGALSDEGGTLTARRITIGAPRDGLSARGPGGGATSLEGAHAALAGPITSVTGSTYTLAGEPDGAALTVGTTSGTVYVDADGSAADASALKAGVFIQAEGTLSDQGKTLTAERITVGGPPDPVRVLRAGGRSHHLR